MNPPQRTIVLAIALLVYGAILVWNCWRVGITVDEPTRLLGGHLYWLNIEDHPPKDQPPLLSMAVGWVPVLMKIPLYRDAPAWRFDWKDHVYAYTLDRQPGARIDLLFFLARLGVICFPLLTALLIWHWGRQLFSEDAALLATVLFLLLPAARGHGALITSDMATAFTYLLAGYRAWRYWRSPSWKNTLWLGLAAGLATIAKFSMLIVPPLALAVVLLRACVRWGDALHGAGDPIGTRREHSSRAGQRPAPQARPRWTPIPQAAVAGLAALLVLIVAYKFDTRRLTWPEIESIRQAEEFPPLFLAALPVLHYVPTPRDMQEGIRSLGVNNRLGNPVFLLGKKYPHGHWAYFLVCLALKPPIGFQILVLLGLGVLLAGLVRRRLPADLLFLLIPPLIYLYFASQASGQLGFRLILPTVVYLVLLAGFGVDTLLARRWGRWLLASVFAFVLVSTARIFPQDISYFNEWAGGPERGWHYLSDSNIDWGHNLPELKSYVDRHRLRQVRYFQFGFDKVHRYFPDGVLVKQALPWEPEYVTSTVLRPEPGVYAVHVSLLYGQTFSEEYRDYLSWFRQRKPDAMAGYGIHIHYVPEPGSP